MSYRYFNNPNDLPAVVISHRIDGSDNDVIVFLQKNVGPDGLPVDSTMALVDSDVLTDAEIETVLSTPVTQGESDYLTDIISARQEMRNEYQAAITRLTDIINLSQITVVNLSTIQQMQAGIQDIARYERFMLKTMSKLFL